MALGTGQPDAAMRARVPHLGYGWLSPGDRYSAALFVMDACAMIDAVASRNRLPLIVAGTGLYIDSLIGIMPLDRPFADASVRARVRREAGVHPQDALHAWLRSISPEAAKRVYAGDSYRTLRALEAALAARNGRTSRPRIEPRRDVRIIVLTVAPSVLRARIERRTADMFARGLIAEAVAVAARHPGAPALSGLGYAEALSAYEGLATVKEAFDLTVRRTLRYAKRQRNWFGHMPGAVAVPADDLEAATRAVLRVARETKRSA